MTLVPYPNDRKLSDHFWLHETAVSASHPELVTPTPDELIPNAERLAKTVLEPCRIALGRPIPIDSWYRSPLLNKAVDGSLTSQHVYAEAADCAPSNPRELFVKLLTKEINVPCGQVIYYPHRQFVHIALPGKAYPTPAFFVCRNPKVYDRVYTLDDVMKKAA